MQGGLDGTDVAVGAGASAAAASFAVIERELTTLVRRIRRSTEQAARRIHPDVSSAGYLLLAQLADSGPGRVGDLAEAFLVDISTASRHIAALRRLGLATTVADPADRRAQVVSATPEGLARLTEIRQQRRDRVRSALDDWPAADLTTFAALLSRFNTDSAETTALPGDRPYDPPPSPPAPPPQEAVPHH